MAGMGSGCRLCSVWRRRVSGQAQDGQIALHAQVDRRQRFHSLQHDAVRKRLLFLGKPQRLHGKEK